MLQRQDGVLGRISVVIPLYNKARYVERAIRSVLSQTRPADEVIVVDDGSTDGGREVAARFEPAGVRVLCQDNAGPGAARNCGAELATGDFLAFLDADDEWWPDYLASMEQEFRADPEAAVIVCGYVDNPVGSEPPQERFRRLGVSDGVQVFDPSMPAGLLNFRTNYMWTCTTMARSSVFHRWGGFYGRDHCVFGEDSMLWLKLMMNERVRFVMKPHAVYHRYASDLNSHAKGPRGLEPFLTHPEELTAACPERLRPALDRFLALRAKRAAIMLGYWGRAPEARALVRRFVPQRALLNASGAACLIACTPLAQAVGPAVLGLLRFLKLTGYAAVRPGVPQAEVGSETSRGSGAGRNAN